MSRTESRKVEEGPYQFVLYDNGDIVVLSAGRVMVDSEWDELDDFQLDLLGNARRALGVS